MSSVVQRAGKLEARKLEEVKNAAEQVTASEVLGQLERHILVDGFKLIFDTEKSQGSRFVDASSGREWIDLYSFYGSQPIGFNHPHFRKPEVQAELTRAAQVKVANADVYTVQYATFVKTFARVMGLEPLNRYFFIEGGALAVENALKAAMDWKVRKNIGAGRGERGTEILHFERAFHGRSGYTLSLTNTDPRKTEYFAKFQWPRVSTPRINFSLAEPVRSRQVEADEQVSRAQIERIIKERGT